MPKQSVFIFVRSKFELRTSLLEGRNPDTLARLVYCNEEHRQFYDETLVQHGNRHMPKRIFHRTYPQAVESIIKYGLIPGGRGLSESGRKHLFFSPLRVNETGYVSGVRADAPVEIAVDIGKAVAAGVDFILTDSDAILTANHIPNDTLLWVINDKEGKTIWTPPSVQTEATATPSSEHVQRRSRQLQAMSFLSELQSRLKMTMLPPLMELHEIKLSQQQATLRTLGIQSCLDTLCRSELIHVPGANLNLLMVCYHAANAVTSFINKGPPPEILSFATSGLSSCQP